jgi:hypothetical protein
MLKTFRHLLDEIDVARQDLAKYPDPKEAIEDAGNRDWYSDKLDEAYTAVEACAERLGKADEKAQERVQSTKNRVADHEAALAARQAEANKTDPDFGRTTFADGGAAGPGGATGQSEGGAKTTASKK